jgi:Icc-related predicted phosphoesterase
LIPCFFVSDLHGSPRRYARLFRATGENPPAALFLGGDLLPSPFAAPPSIDPGHKDFVNDFLAAGFERLRERLGSDYPQVFLILGNDDARFEEAAFLDLSAQALWRYAHDRRSVFAGYDVYGYSYIPPTPFQLKDWERYDVSRYVDPGCLSPEEGRRSVPVPAHEVRHATIQGDLERLAGERPLDRAVFLFHGPPYRTKLDRAALDGKSVDHVPLDVHVGSIAARRFIEQRQPWLTLHGHVHESARLSGDWRDRLGRTPMLSAAHDGPELALVRFDLEDPANACRELLSV